MDKTPTRSRFPWLKAGLAVSVLLNLVVLGILGGLVTRTGPQRSVLQAAVTALPADDRRVWRQETRNIWREARSSPEGPAVPQQMIAALRADDFDAEAFSHTLRQTQEQSLKVSTRMHERLIARVVAMTQEERHTYADALQEQLDSHRWRGGQREQR